MSLYLRKPKPAEFGRPSGSPTVTRRKQRGTRRAANDPVSSDRETRAVDPMLLVYRERVQTFELLAEMFRRSMASMTARLNRAWPRSRGVNPRGSRRAAGC